MQEFDIQFVCSEWEQIRRRIKTVHHGSKVAALLGGCCPIDVDQSHVPPLLIIRASENYQYRHLLPFVEEDVVSWAIEMTLGVVCQVQLLPPLDVVPRVQPPLNVELRAQPPLVAVSPAGQGSPLAQPIVKTRTIRRQNWFEPLKLERIQADWMQIKQLISEEDKDREIAEALSACQPIALEMDEYPPTLVLQAINAAAQATLARRAADGSLMLALLNELGHVCRMKILAPGSSLPS